MAAGQSGSPHPAAPLRPRPAALLPLLPGSKLLR